MKKAGVSWGNACLFFKIFLVALSDNTLCLFDGKRRGVFLKILNVYHLNNRGVIILSGGYHDQIAGFDGVILGNVIIGFTSFCKLDTAKDIITRAPLLLK